MSTQNLTKDISLEHTRTHIHIELDSPHPVISSAVLNGGVTEANHIVILKVAQHSEKSGKALESPDITLSNYCRQRNWQGTTVGMMTAASMDSLRLAREVKQGVETIVLVTSGLSNPRRAGDYAEHREIGTSVAEQGTINIIVLTTASLTQSAMIEAIMIATEAKAAALQNLGIRSPVSKGLATGTGTDAIAIANGHGPTEIRHCGKHVVFGEILARLVINGVTSSLTRNMSL